MFNAISLIVIVLVGIYFVVLGVMALAKPDLAAKFLLGFAASASKHYLELTLRLIVGGSLINQAPNTLFPVIFNAFGWILIATTTVMILVPWQIHQRFTQKSVPKALRFITLIGIASILLGGGIIFMNVATFGQ